MTTTDEQPPLTPDERSFVFPPSSALLEEERAAQESAQDATAVLQNFVTLGKRCGFPTPLVAGYIRHQEKALDTWAEDTGHQQGRPSLLCRGLPRGKEEARSHRHESARREGRNALARSSASAGPARGDRGGETGDHRLRERSDGADCRGARVRNRDAAHVAQRPRVAGRGSSR